MKKMKAMIWYNWINNIIICIKELKEFSLSFANLRYIFQCVYACYGQTIFPALLRNFQVIT